jgi:hypothetical protein
MSYCQIPVQPDFSANRVTLLLKKLSISLKMQVLQFMKAFNLIISACRFKIQLCPNKRFVKIQHSFDTYPMKLLCIN